MFYFTLSCHFVISHGVQSLWWICNTPLFLAPIHQILSFLMARNVFICCKRLNDVKRMVYCNLVELQIPGPPAGGTVQWIAWGDTLPKDPQKKSEWVPLTFDLVNRQGTIPWIKIHPFWYWIRSNRRSNMNISKTFHQGFRGSTWWFLKLNPQVKKWASILSHGHDDWMITGGNPHDLGHLHDLG